MTTQEIIDAIQALDDSIYDIEVTRTPYSELDSAFSRTNADSIDVSFLYDGDGFTGSCSAHTYSHPMRPLVDADITCHTCDEDPVRDECEDCSGCYAYIMELAGKAQDIIMTA